MVQLASSGTPDRQSFGAPQHTLDRLLMVGDHRLSESEIDRGGGILHGMQLKVRTSCSSWVLVKLEKIKKLWANSEDIRSTL